MISSFVLTQTVRSLDSVHLTTSIETWITCGETPHRFKLFHWIRSTRAKMTEDSMCLLDQARTAI